MSSKDKTWFAIDGTLPPIDYAGQSDFRSPDAVAEYVVARYSGPGDWVLDPFCGFGTTVRVAAAMGRQAIGFEIEADRAAFAARAVNLPNRIIDAPVQTLHDHDLPKFDLVFTSPPYITVRLEDDPWGPTYFADMRRIFQLIKQQLSPSAIVVLEVSNIKTEDGFRPLAWQFADLLTGDFTFENEIVRCNTSDWPAGPGVDHSSLLVFSNRA